MSGVNTGLSVYDGQIESLANGDRADLVLDGRRPAEIENLTSLAVLRSGGSSIRILGINRLPGSAEDCGVAGFAPGAPLPSASSSGPAAQAVLNPKGRVVSIGAPGGTLPAGDSAVQAIGTDAAWLSANAHPGRHLTVLEQLRTASGAPFRLDPQMSIASAGLTLTEEAEVMRSLGAVDAMNLDGGGSTQFASEGQLLNDASSSPLRPVGDTIQVVPLGR